MDDPILLNDWHPVARVEDVSERQPLKARLLGEDLVLWRAEGQAKVWQDLCIHRGTRLSLGRIEGDRLECPYHGWTYGADGRCVHIPAHPEQAPPAKARVKTYQAREQYGLVWACLGQPAQDVPPFPEWDDPAFRKVFCGPYPVQAAGPRIVENFLDVGHFPFVHEGILGDRSRPEIEEYEAERTAEGVVARGVRIYQPNGYGVGIGGPVSYTYKIFRPLTVYFIKESDGPCLSIFMAVTPHDPLHCTAWLWEAMNYGHDVPAAELSAFQDTIFGQDTPIVQSQRPELLPLDLQAELHLRSDRAAIAYRMWLRDLGLAYGTA
jgi:phenylpropionate dioxygenase-like ring-hydroxylating dioxygenase large terminal subunit